MANPWFRMYHEFATDPKVQMLSETDQRRYIMILCLKCCNDDVTLHETEIAFQLRISNEEYAVTKKVLIEKGLIDDNNKPMAWDKRQFSSDSSAARVAKHREKKKQECNVTVTKSNALDTDSDTYTYIKENKKKTDLSFSNEIFTYWKKVMEKGAHTKLTPKREKNINARLKDGYTVENIKSAIDGCINSAFHMGANNDRKKFNDIELICRSGEKIESFMELKNLSNAANSDSGLSKNNEVNYAAHQNNNQDRRTRNQVIADRITQDYMESCGSDFLENERPLRNGMDEPVSNRDVIESSKERVG